MGYVFRAAGTLDTGSAALTPGAPAGKTVGDLLLLATAARAATETVATPSGWTLLLDTTSTVNGSCALFARIADGTASDTPTTMDWSGSSPGAAQIAAFSGDVFTDLATIVVHSNVAGITTNAAEIPIPALTITTANCLVVAVGKKQKTATSDGGSATPPAGISNELGDSWPAGASQLGFVWGYTIQTTATNFSAGGWDQTPDENLPYASLIVALQSDVVVKKLKLLAHSSAASAASIEGVVLNAARDTVIGEFSGQAFEAALESGEAVLLVDIADITPDGSTLTTSDTPIVFAYNATGSIIGPGSATVIEV